MPKCDTDAGRAGLLERMRPRERLDLHAGVVDAPHGRIGLHVASKKPEPTTWPARQTSASVMHRPGNICRSACCGRCVSSRQRLVLPVPHPLDHGALRRASVLRQVVAHARHRHRMQVGYDDLRRARAPARGPRDLDGSSAGFGCVSSRYSMIAIDWNSTGPPSSMIAGISICGLTARKDPRAACPSSGRFDDLVGLDALEASAMRTRNDAREHQNK